MKTMRWMLLAAAGLSGGSASAVPRTPMARPAVEVKLVPWRTRWAISADINGKTGLYLLDTGAGLTLASNATLKRIGCPLWRRTVGFNMMGQKGEGPRCDGAVVKVGGQTLAPLPIGPIEMGGNNPKDAALDGLFGLNLFEDKAVTIDFAAGILTIESPGSLAQRTRTMRPLPIRLKREVDGWALAVVTMVPTPKGPLAFELDSGNGGTILASKHVAADVGMDPTREGKQHADFQVLGDIRAVSDDAFTPDMIMDGNLGMPFLRNWVVTLDLKNARAWIGRPPVPPVPAIPLDQATKK